MKKFKTLIIELLSHEVISYVLFGILTTFVGIFAYWLSISVGTGIVLANTISHIIAVSFAYITNKIWVFKSPDFSSNVVFKEYFMFGSSRIISYVLDTILLVFLVYMLYFDPLISRVFTSVLVIIINYFISKKIVFKK